MTLPNNSKPNITKIYGSHNLTTHPLLPYLSVVYEAQKRLNGKWSKDNAIDIELLAAMFGQKFLMSRESTKLLLKILCDEFPRHIQWTPRVGIKILRELNDSRK